MTTMNRGLMILGLALALTLFGVLMYAQSPAYGLPLTAGVAFGVALCLRPFPKLRTLERGLPFAVLYVFTYFLASNLGLGRSPNSATLMMIAVLVGSVVCAFIVWSTLGQVRQRDRLVCTLGMIGIGILTAFFSGPQGGAGKFMAFLLDVLHLTPDAATRPSHT